MRIGGDVGIAGLLMDIDGVLSVRGEPIAGAAAALAEVRRLGIPLRLLTNVTMRSRADVAAGLQRMGFEVEAGDIYTASALAAHYLRQQGSPPIWVLLNGTALADFAGIPMTEEAPAFVVLGDLGDGFNAGVMHRIYRALLGGAQLVAIQHNAAWIAADGPRLDVGAWAAALEYAAGQRALVMGKPSALAYQLPAQAMGLAPAQMAMVGDDPEVDLVGARAVGMQTVFVRTSAVPGRRAVGADEFDYALDSVADLPALLKGDRP